MIRKSLVSGRKGKSINITAAAKSKSKGLLQQKDAVVRVLYGNVTSSKPLANLMSSISGKCFSIPILRREILHPPCLNKRPNYGFNTQHQ